MKFAIAVVAAILALVGNIPYLVDIVRKKVKPHPYTWLVWTIVSATIFFGQVAKGAGIGALPTLASEIFTLIIFLFSLRYGFGQIKKSDTYFLVAALIGLVPWLLTKDPTLSVIIMVSIDFIAFIPTLRKTWQFPETEIPILYAMNALRHFLALFSLQAYNIATMLHSLVMIVLNTCMTLMIVVPRRMPKK